MIINMKNDMKNEIIAILKKVKNAPDTKEAIFPLVYELKLLQNINSRELQSLFEDDEEINKYNKEKHKIYIIIIKKYRSDWENYKNDKKKGKIK